MVSPLLKPGHARRRQSVGTPLRLVSIYTVHVELIISIQYTILFTRMNNSGWQKWSFLLILVRFAQS